MTIFNKIYESIEKGISNILLVDDDSSINYRKSELNSNLKVIDNLETLDQLFKNGVDIFQYQISCISLICADGHECQLSEYENELIKMIKITTPELKANDCEIIFPVDECLYIASNNMWCYNGDIAKISQSRSMPYTIKTEEDAINDFSLYQTNKILEENSYWLPAYRKCLDRKIAVGNDQYQGYLPVIGQLALLLKYIDLIKYILKTIYGCDLYYNYQYLTNPEDLFFWSASEESDEYAWTIFPEIKIIKKMRKSKGGNAMPFFKKL